MILAASRLGVFSAFVEIKGGTLIRVLVVAHDIEESAELLKAQAKRYKGKLYKKVRIQREADADTETLKEKGLWIQLDEKSQIRVAEEFAKNFECKTNTTEIQKERLKSDLTKLQRKVLNIKHKRGSQDGN